MMNQRRSYYDYFNLVVLLSLCYTVADGFVSKYQYHPAAAHHSQRNRYYVQLQHGSISSLSASSLKNSREDEGEDENKKLLEKARLLREEASKLEEKLQPARKRANQEAIGATTSPVPKITELPDSIWTISYRFSSQPKNDDDEEQGIIPNYSGKFTIRLLSDGYSELVEQSDESKIKIKKIWGWDEEYSREDEQQYLLFSMDVTLPKADPKLPGETERYYFQARIDQNEKSQIIELSDGTVTCKKDISEKTKGRWGLFQVAGILSQFRYVGDFVSKPSTLSQKTQ